MVIGTDIDEKNGSFLMSKGYTSFIESAGETMGMGVPIVLPTDYRVLRMGSVEKFKASDLRAGGRALDIGEETMEDLKRS
jgi:3-phosphoglycerate kinase